MNLLKISMLSLMFIALTGFGQTAFAKAPDAKEDGTGWCDGLDKKGGLYSTCIRAHSAQNLVEHLMSVNVEGPALTNAKASLAQAVSIYEELAGGYPLPGLQDCFRAADYIGDDTWVDDLDDVNWWADICMSFGGDMGECYDIDIYYTFVQPLYSCIHSTDSTIAETECGIVDEAVALAYNGDVNVCDDGGLVFEECGAEPLQPCE